MKVSLYDDYRAFLIKIKKYFALAIVLALVLLALAVGCLFLVGKVNATLLTVLSVAFSTLGGWLFISVYFVKIYPLRKRIGFLNWLSSLMCEEFTATVSGFNKEFTTSEGIKAVETNVKVNGEERVILYPVDLGEPRFSVGSVVTFYTGYNNVFAYEVKDEK